MTAPSRAQRRRHAAGVHRLGLPFRPPSGSVHPGFGLLNPHPLGVLDRVACPYCPLRALETGGANGYSVSVSGKLFSAYSSGGACGFDLWPLRGLEGVPGLPGAPQDEAGLMRKFET